MLNISITSKNSGLNKTEVNELKNYSNVILQHSFSYISDKKNIIFSQIANQLCYIDLLITNNVAISKFNFDYRGLKEPTNVLALQMFHVDEITDIKHEHIHLGSIAVSIEYSKAEAVDSQIDWHNHYARLLIHGFLHCLGYDHNNDAEAHTMNDLENEILKYCGINEDSIVSEYWS